MTENAERTTVTLDPLAVELLKSIIEDDNDARNMVDEFASKIGIHGGESDLKEMTLSEAIMFCCSFTFGMMRGAKLQESAVVARHMPYIPDEDRADIIRDIKGRQRVTDLPPVNSASVRFAKKRRR